jgi:hypothetical protein
MLRIKVNTSELNYERVELNISDLYYSDGNHSYITVTTSTPHKLRGNDEVIVVRSEEDYYEETTKEISLLSPYSFEIESFPDIALFVEKASVENYKFRLMPNSSIEYRKALVLDLSSEHIFPKNRYNINNLAILTDDYYSSDDAYTQMCVGDSLLYNGIIHEAESITSDGKYIMNNAINNMDYGEVKFANSDGEEILLKGWVAPVLEDKTTNLYRLIYFFDENDDEINSIAKYISQNYESLNFYSPDVRFFVEDEDISGDGKYHLSLVKPDEYTIATIVYRENGHCHVSFPIAENFAVNMAKEALLEEGFVEEQKTNSINEIVDYEKRMFYPVIYDDDDPEAFDNFNDNELVDLNEIVFNLHFIERHYDDSNGWVYGNSEWVTDDDMAWNNYSISDNGGLERNSKPNYGDSKETLSDSDADLLWYLGFTDEDVYYQKKSLQKSFLRLSFYDSRDRANQTLQFYSTIFLDTGDLYNKYVKQKTLNYDSDDVLVSLEHAEDTSLRLSATFSCSDKNNMSACSEGFYLYAFPSLVKGNELTPLYMKVEFNHAKYGRTIPFIMPTKSNYWTNVDYDKWDNIIRWNPKTNEVDNNFPVNYSKSNGGINMKRLINDMYIKVYVKYDFNKNRYVWFLADRIGNLNGSGSDGNLKLVFNLWEPRINGVEGK